jgi:phosphatidylglycerol---prolipoprotein diacylglyceryl transferase
VIPYFDIASFTIGGVSFHTFGLLVALGTLLGHAMVSNRAKKLGLGPASTIDLFVLTGFASGFFFGHALDVLLYHPATLWNDPLELFKIHHGLSSFGGVFGAIVGGYIFVRAMKLSPWVFADLCTYAFPFGWLLGRAGCAIAHDHKGHLTNSWLAVRFPEGPRYDLGLIELAFVPLLCALVVWVSRTTKRPGMISGALAVAYALIRFPLDFLRATDLGPDSDVRYGGLTPAQWFCFATLLFGLWILGRSRHHAPFPPEA